MTSSVSEIPGTHGTRQAASFRMRSGAQILTIQAASGHPRWAYGQGRFTIMPSWAANADFRCAQQDGR